MNKSSGIQGQFNQKLIVEEVKIPVPWGHISGKILKYFSLSICFIVCYFISKGKRWGSKLKQPILCLHGWMDNAGTFDSLVPHLCDDHAFLCIDLPGHGLSSYFPKGQYYYVFWDGVMLIRRIVKYFKWNKVR